MITMEKNEGLTIFNVSGEVTAHDIIMQAVQYLKEEPTESSMWDFTEATKLEITTLEMQGIADSLKHVVKGHNIRKVALVSSKSINIGLGKVFGAFAQMAGLPYAYKSFRNTEDAVVWLENESI